MNWLLQGDSTLLDFMKQRNFPENLETPLFGRALKSKDQLQRHSLIIKQIMRQIISSLNKMHATGIVHRDVKPSNLVVTNKGKLKFIDFGAATDLRVGKNFVPERGMLDPDYCPPELYVLPEETPNPPPAPVAAALSPFIWQVKNYISKNGGFRSCVLVGHSCIHVQCLSVSIQIAVASGNATETRDSRFS
jgi:serine/threonine protein kinase